MTSYLNSHESWLQYYIERATSLSYSTRSNRYDLNSAMISICESALSSRAAQLRDSDSYHSKKFKTAAAGFIPFAKIAVSVGVSEKFANEALRAFGVSDATGLQSLAERLEKTTGRDNLPWDLLKSIGKHTLKELLSDTGIHVASEAAHLKPVIGQIISAGTGYTKTRKRLIKIIEKVHSWAEDIHKKVLLPLVVEEVLIPASPPAYMEKNDSSEGKYSLDYKSLKAYPTVTVSEIAVPEIPVKSPNGSTTSKSIKFQKSVKSPDSSTTSKSMKFLKDQDWWWYIRSGLVLYAGIWAQGVLSANISAQQSALGTLGGTFIMVSQVIITYGEVTWSGPPFLILCTLSLLYQSLVWDDVKVVASFAVFLLFVALVRFVLIPTVRFIIGWSFSIVKTVGILLKRIVLTLATIGYKVFVAGVYMCYFALLVWVIFEILKFMFSYI